MPARRTVMRAAAFAVVAAIAGPAPAAEPQAQRIVSIGGAVTEIVYALGQQDRLVARDSTSTFPPEANDLKNVGYARALSPEGVLSVSPDLVLASEGFGPPETRQVLTSADVRLVVIAEQFSTEGVLTKIRDVGKALNAEAEAGALIEKVRQEIDVAVANAAALSNGPAPRVMFVMSNQNGRLIAAGDDTAVAAILELAGAENALTGFTGYKPVSDEAVVTAAPEAVLMMDRTGPHMITDEDLFALPAIAPTPAAQTRLVIRMDGSHLLGFGPRTAAAIAELSLALSGALNQ